MSAAEECPYILLKNPETPYLNSLSRVICAISTIVNIIGFYLILTRSKKESRLYTAALFSHQFFLYLAQTYWSIFLNPQSFLPFPAFRATGFFGDSIGLFLLAFPWLALFDIYIISLILIGVIRFRLIMRKDHILNLPKWLVNFLFTILGVGGFLLVSVGWYISKSSKSETKECAEFLKLPEIMIFNKVGLQFCMVLLILGQISILGGYFFISALILHELKIQSQLISNLTKKHHMKVMKDIQIQITIKAVFQASFACWILISNHIDPQTDTRAIFTFFHSLFVFSPIPGTITMIFQKPEYRDFFESSYKTSRIGSAPFFIITRDYFAKPRLFWK